MFMNGALAITTRHCPTSLAVYPKKRRKMNGPSGTPVPNHDGFGMVWSYPKEYTQATVRSRSERCGWMSEPAILIGSHSVYATEPSPFEY